MMQDFTIDDIIDEVVVEICTKSWFALPPKTVKLIVKHILRGIFKKLKNQKNSVSMYNSSIARFYHKIDFSELERKFIDIDETKLDTNKPITQGYLKVLDAKGSPRLRVRSKPNSTLVFHRGNHL